MLNNAKQQKDLLSPTNSQGSREIKKFDKEVKDKKDRSSKGDASSIKLKEDEKKAKDKKKSSKKDKPITPPSTEESSQAGSPDMGATRRAATRYALQINNGATTPTFNNMQPGERLPPKPRVPLPAGKVNCTSSRH